MAILAYAMSVGRCSTKLGSVMRDAIASPKTSNCGSTTQSVVAWWCCGLRLANMAEAEARAFGAGRHDVETASGRRRLPPVSDRSRPTSWWRDAPTMAEQSGGQGTGAAATSTAISRRTSRRVSGAVVSAAFAAAGAADRRRFSTAGGRKSVSLCRFSVQADSERRQSELAEAATASEDDNADDVQSQLPFPDFPAKAFFIFDQTSIVRRWCLKAITWPYPFSSN